MCKLDHSIESEILSAVSQTSPPTTTSVQKGTTDGKDNTVETGEQHTVTLGTVTSPMAASYHSLSYSSSVHTLEKEFSLVDVDIPNVVIEDVCVCCVCVCTVCVYVCMCVCVSMHVCVCMRACMCLCVQVRAHIICLSLHTCIHMCGMYICIHMYIPHIRTYIL